MDQPKNPHDALFKQVFAQTEHAARLLRCILPAAIAQAIDWATLKLLPGSFVDDDLREQHTDLLFSAKLRDRDLRIQILFEHQSTAIPLMPYRLLGYMRRGWDQYISEHPNTTVIPVILPVVLHHSERGWSQPTAFEELYDADPDVLPPLREHIPGFRFVLEDISRSSDVELRLRALTALGRLVLCCFRYARSHTELGRRLGGWTDMVREVLLAPNGALALAAVWRYIWVVTKASEREELKMLVNEVRDPEVRREIVSAADLLWEEGHEKGHEAGRRASLRLVVEKQLTQKFDALPEHAVEVLNKATADDLERMADRLLAAQSLSEVLG